MFETAKQAKDALRLVKDLDGFQTFRETLASSRYHAELYTKRGNNRADAFSFVPLPWDATRANYNLSNGKCGRCRWDNLHKVINVRMWVRPNPGSSALDLQEA
jgi:hypothetical protein